MKFLAPLLIFAFIAIASSFPQVPPKIEEIVEKVVNFINNFPGGKDELEKALVIRMEQRAKNFHNEYNKEEIENFVETVASKLNGKVMNGEDFKKLAAAQLAARAAKA